MLIEIRSLSAAECRIRTFMSIPLFPSGYKYFLEKYEGAYDSIFLYGAGSSATIPNEDWGVVY